MATSLERLTETLLLAVPALEAVGIGPAGATAAREVEVRLAATASQADRNALAAALAAFDFGDAAEATWQADKRRARAARELQQGTLAAVMLLRALLAILLDEVNLLRQAAGLQPRTANQLGTALLAKLTAGAADAS